MWRESTRLYDMLDSARLIQGYVDGLTLDDFIARVDVRDKVLCRLMIIGEAAKNVSDAFREAHPEIPWRRVAGFRDILVHQYFRLDFRMIWDITQDRIPALIAALEPLIPTEDD
jgi:uncharacterized protein with HEPN domain